MASDIERVQAALEAAGAAGGVHYRINQRSPVVTPYIVHTRVSSPITNFMRGPNTLQQLLWQVDVFAPTLRQADHLAGEIAQAISQAFRQGVRTNIADDFEDLVKLYRITQDFSLWLAV